MNFTPEQEKAIRARGNTLVLAGAGSGKTRTLVERCARILLDREHPVSARNILVVTFNEAAAAEVRDRLRTRLEEIAVETSDERVLEQLAMLDCAQISTLHSFCFTLLREHFYALELDPAVSILDETQAGVLFLNTIQEVLREHYAGLHSFSGELKEFLRSHLRGWDKPLIEFVRKVHEFTQTRPDPEGWFARQMAALDRNDHAPWELWHAQAVRDWCAWWLPWLRQLPESNTNAHACAEQLAAACETADASVLARVLERDGCWPSKKKTAHRKPFEKLFDEARFLASLQPGQGETKSPLQEDWEWSRGPIRLLLLLSMQFGERFAAAKKERSVLDFHDLEQGALRLLWDGEQPTSVAEVWRKRFEAVFVDEYQDINAAQDRIIRAVSRPGPPGNRFLVGDNKQSIYRFRQADPAIFQKYLAAPDGWLRADLAENFRSHQGILDFINPLFTWVMRETVGGVAYDAAAQLKFPDSEERAHLRRAPGKAQVELHFCFFDPEAESGAADGADDWEDLEKVEREARLVAARLREMVESGFEIAEGPGEAGKRRVQWRDMVVLLRSASAKLEIYSKAFEAMGVPLQTKQNAFYNTQEVLDLCSLLSVLDNPLQDIPLVAALRSPFCGLTAEELAWVRIVSEARPFWRALNEFHESKKEAPGREKIEAFLTRYHSWRRDRGSASLSARVERILADTGYDEWLLSQPRGRQRHANVRQFLRVARQFDESRGESLYLFLRHLEELQEAVGDIEPALAVDENSVRLMTVHQSKGLEFPVVVAPDLGKRFNRSDATQSMLIDETYGVCAMIKPPGTGQRYPGLPLWLARKKQRVEAMGEELRLMYVAFTRARNHLILFGSASERAASSWSIDGEPLPHHILKAGCWLDWIGGWLNSVVPRWWEGDSTEAGICAIRVHSGGAAAVPSRPANVLDALEETQISALEARLNFAYPHTAATLEAAKTSVTALRRRAAEADDEARPWLTPLATNREASDGLKRGLACHTFLEHLNLEGKLDATGLAAQAGAMKPLTPDGVALIDFESLADFWRSDFGREILGSKGFVRRELPFTCKLHATSVRDLIAVPEGEFVIVQGIADLVVLRDDEIWLVDFKTDEVRGNALKRAAEGYQSQLALYALALEAIYKRPVTRKALYFVPARELVPA